MKPNTDKDLLLAYIDDRLDTSARDAAEARFAEQPELRKEMEALQRLQRSLRRTFNDAASQSMPSAAIWQRIDQQVMQRPAGPLKRRRSLIVTLPLGLGLMLVVALGLWLSTRGQSHTTVGPRQRVIQAPYVYQPHIAVDPGNPDHLAGVATSLSEPECVPPSGGGQCTLHIALATSTDGGGRWEERQLDQFKVFGGSVGFGPGGQVYVSGVLERGGIFIYRLESVGKEAAFKYTFPTLMQGAGNPWVTIDQHTGTLYVTYTGPTGGQGFDGGILLQSSTDQGESWSAPTVVSAGPLIMQGNKQVALPLVNGQVMLSSAGHLAVTWLSPEAIGQPKASVWAATSTDAGKTFGSPQRIAETWGYASTAASGGSYHVFYKSGTQQRQELTVATSRDAGSTWSTAVVSHDVPMVFGNAPAPGVGVAPDGTIDVTFYAPTQFCTDADALSRAVVEHKDWVDPCTYQLYYTFSKDGGRTWAKPSRLNEQPIEGKEFVRMQGYSMPGQHIGTGSTNTYAYAIWLDGTEAYFQRIQR